MTVSSSRERYVHVYIYLVDEYMCAIQAATSLLATNCVYLELRLLFSLLTSSS